MKRYFQLNDATHGLYFIYDNSTGNILASDKPLKALIPAEQSLGFLQALLPIVAAVAPGVMNLATRKGDQALLDQQKEQLLIQQQMQARQQAAQQKNMMILAGAGLAGILLFTLLK